MSLYDDALRGWKANEPTLVESYPVACYLGVTSPVIAVILLLVIMATAACGSPSVQETEAQVPTAASPSALVSSLKQDCKAMERFVAGNFTGNPYDLWDLADQLGTGSQLYPVLDSAKPQSNGWKTVVKARVICAAVSNVYSPEVDG